MAILGIDWGDIGRHAFGAVHTAGKTLASAFGAKEGAERLEQVWARAGILPRW